MKKMLSFILTTGLVLGQMTTSASAASFTDVKTTDWYYSYVTNMQEKAYVTGVTTTTYGPDQTLSSCEFWVMISVAFLGETLHPLLGNTDPWWDSYSAAMERTGCLDGTEPYTGFLEFMYWGMRPYYDISRYDMAQIMYNLAKHNGVASLTTAQKNAALAKVNDNLSANYKEAVALCLHYGFINGKSNGAFDGDSFLTRAEGAVVLSAMVDSPYIKEDSVHKYS